MNMVKKVTVVVPCYNESPNVLAFYKELKYATKKIPAEIDLLYVNDGSKDNTLELLHKLAREDSQVHILDLSRNFGKEAATSAGIAYATGDAVILIDGDGQHPPELIKEFISRWLEGADIVVGVRKSNQKEGIVKKYGSVLFYKVLRRLTKNQMTPGLTDFCLLDKSVKADFNLLTERNRITRGLIDWLGYRKVTVEFAAKERIAGNPTYKLSSLFNLALNSFVSLSLKPLHVAFYIGALVLPVSIALALFATINALLGDPLGLNITGTAYMVILCLFLLGLSLVSQGVMALYLSHIHTETQNRPLYIINERTSKINK